MKKLLLIALVALLSFGRASADEGMWILPLLEKMNYQDMRAAGLKLTADQIYNTNGNSLKDAIVQFGGGCTGEIVSPDGLLFTNYHCGYSWIQKLSSLENDYLKNGFWAMNKGQELPAPGLSVRFVRDIHDVTTDILKGITDNTVQAERDELVKSNIEKITKEYKDNNPGKTVIIRDFYGANQYFLFIIDEYKDVRMVGTPPYAVGKFGNETDNWSWPRHTADFAVFRVYMGPDGKPAEYSPENIPYAAPTHLKISLKGIKEGDYAMVMGFPGSTTRYMTVSELDQLYYVSNPVRILIRGERQDILKRNMVASDEIRIKYSNKYQGSSNYWKNSIGMNRGIKRLDVRDRKVEREDQFTAWVNSDPSRVEKYSTALPLIKQAVDQRTQPAAVIQYLSEAMTRSTEITNVASLSTLLKDTKKTPEERLEQARSRANDFYKDYDEGIDRMVAVRMFRVLADSVAGEVDLHSTLKNIYPQYNGDLEPFVNYLYDNSVFANEIKFNNYLNTGDFSDIDSDPAVQLYTWITDKTRENRAKVNELMPLYKEGQRLFIAGLLEMEPDVKHYPDANSTIRFTYGNVWSYSPADAVIYDYYTTLAGLIAKEDPTNPFDFTVTDKIKKLYNEKDYGIYGMDGVLPLNFLTNNDITGGNSGSPVLNGDGELIGLAFDGNWEAMSGDIVFEPELQRTICVDIRYVMFIIDKYGDASYLFDEMSIVR